MPTSTERTSSLSKPACQIGLGNELVATLSSGSAANLRRLAEELACPRVEVLALELADQDSIRSAAAAQTPASIERASLGCFDAPSTVLPAPVPAPGARFRRRAPHQPRTGWRTP
jgi:hypothetical protein